MPFFREHSHYGFWVYSTKAYTSSWIAYTVNIAHNVQHMQRGCRSSVRDHLSSGCRIAIKCLQSKRNALNKKAFAQLFIISINDIRILEVAVTSLLYRQSKAAVRGLQEHGMIIAAESTVDNNGQDV